MTHAFVREVLGAGDPAVGQLAASLLPVGVAAVDFPRGLSAAEARLIVGFVRALTPGEGTVVVGRTPRIPDGAWPGAGRLTTCVVVGSQFEAWVLRPDDDELLIAGLTAWWRTRGGHWLIMATSSTVMGAAMRSAISSWVADPSGGAEGLLAHAVLVCTTYDDDLLDSLARFRAPEIRCALVEAAARAGVAIEIDHS